jgi:hypothetical protein
MSIVIAFQATCFTDKVALSSVVTVSIALFTMAFGAHIVIRGRIYDSVCEGRLVFLSFRRMPDLFRSACHTTLIFLIDNTDKFLTTHILQRIISIFVTNVSADIGSSEVVP